MDVSMLDAAGKAFVLIFNPWTLLMLSCGVVMGLVLGILPGIGGLAGTALLLPFTFSMDPIAAMALLFWRTRIWFRVWRADRWMPLLVGFFLVAGFIWFAENISTFSHAWVYPDQQDGWKLVRPEKLGAWYLLMYISFVLVAALNGTREKV